MNTSSESAEIGASAPKDPPQETSEPSGGDSIPSHPPSVTQTGGTEASQTAAPLRALDRAEFDRRRRHRSLVTAAILFAMVFLFYFIAIARLQK